MLCDAPCKPLRSSGIGGLLYEAYGFIASPVGAMMVTITLAKADKIILRGSFAETGCSEQEPRMGDVFQNLDPPLQQPRVEFCERVKTGKGDVPPLQRGQCPN